jgi:hypothetical protein
VREILFTGTHRDVGGGWPEAAFGPAKIPLLWTIEETKALNLDYATKTVHRLVRCTHAGIDPAARPDGG